MNIRIQTFKRRKAVKDYIFQNKNRLSSFKNQVAQNVAELNSINNS